MKQIISSLVRTKRFRWAIVIFLIDAAFFNLVNPVEGSSFIAIVGCLLLITTISLILQLLIDAMSVFVPISGPVRKRLSVALTLVAAFLVVMQSIGQLSSRDVLAVIPLGAVLYFYLAYSTAKQR